MTKLEALHEELGRVAFSDRGLGDVLDEITAIARRALPGAESTSITLIRGDKPYTVAHDGQLALDLDELQYERDYGPCVDAARSGQVLLIDDMGTEQRWPDYTRHAVERGAGSSLSIPLPFQTALIGALNNYATRPHAFDDEDLTLAEEIAVWIAAAVANASASAANAEEAAGMRAAMGKRAVIEQAKGILMERHKITADLAFAVLTRASQRSGVKLRDVADALVRTGTLLGED